MNSEKLQQLKDEIAQELQSLLRNSNFGKLLQKYGISGENVLRVDYTLDLAQIKFSDASDAEKINTIADSQIKIASCAFCIPCPVNGDPIGCWIC
jgi:hypothetical protein